MDDLPIPDSTGESLVLGLVVLAILGLYFLIRRTHRRAEDEYWEGRHDHPTVPDPTPTPVPIGEWTAGDRVWIISGPYAPSKGEIVQVLPAADRLVVAVDVPGGAATPVELRSDQVQRASR